MGDFKWTLTVGKRAFELTLADHPVTGVWIVLVTEAGVSRGDTDDLVLAIAAAYKMSWDDASTWLNGAISGRMQWQKELMGRRS